MKTILILLGSMSLVLSCNYSRVKTTAAPPSENQPGSITDSQWLTQNLFQARCASCHNSGRQPGGHKFETEKDLLDNVVRKTIVAGSPSTSSIYTIIESGAMPTRGDKATPTELSVLSCWITEGATADSTTCVQKFGLSGTANPGGNPGSGTPTPIPTSTPTPTPSPTPDPGNDDGGGDNNGEDDNGGNDDDGNGEGGGDGGEVPVVKFSEIQQPILTDRCAGCHGSENPAAHVVLLSLENIKNPTTGPALVQCGNASASLLYTVVASDDMPAFSEALSPDLKLKLKNWIDGGCQP